MKQFVSANPMMLRLVARPPEAINAMVIGIGITTIIDLARGLLTETMQAITRLIANAETRLIISGDI